MTQHDETGTATGQPAPAQQPPGQDQPARPSPYLDTGSSLPQAYLAPPQPGQPKYGTAPGAWSAGGQFGQPGAGQQGAWYQGRPVPGQGSTPPGYGRPRSARQAFGPAARRDPAIAGPWERLLASMLDWIIIVAVASLAFISPLLQISREMQAVATRYTDVNSPQEQAALNAIMRDPSNQRALLFWFLAMFGIALVYYWAQHAIWGATIGKRALGTRVVTATDRSKIGVRAAGIRTVAFLIGPAIAVLLARPYSIPGGLLWLVDTALPLFDARVQCLHDKLAGTIVIRQRWLDQQARSTSPW
jgi:uncharacterized RDD family membrane protein YckC